MSKRLITSVLIYLIAHFNLCAQPLVDSLVSKLQEPLSTSERIDVLHKIVWEQSLTNPTEAIEYAKESLLLSEKVNDSTRIARSYNRIALVFDYAGSFDLAEKNYIKAYEIKKACDGYESCDGLLNNLGSVYYYKGAYDKSMDFYLKSLKIRENKESTDTLAKIKSIAQSYNNIGLLLKSQSNYKEALKYYYNGLAIKEKLGDTKGQIITLSNIGVMYMQLDSISAAESNLDRALHISDSINDRPSQAMLLNNFALLYSRNKDWNKAKSQYLKAIELYKELGDEMGEATANINLALAELELGDIDAARNTALSALDYANMGSVPEVKLSALHVLSKIELNVNPKLSVEYLNRFIALKDSVQDLKIISKVNQLAAMYETEKKETEIELLRQENSLVEQENENKDLLIARNRTYLIALVMGIVLVLVISYLLILYFKSKKKAAEEKANKLHEQHQRELDQLRNTIERQIEAPNNTRLSYNISQSELNKYLLNPLSERELDVLYQIADGLTNKEIAEKLFISVNTVKTHVLRIYEKLDVQNRTAAAVKANSLQIIQ